MSTAMLSAGARILLADRKWCGPVGVESVDVPVRWAAAHGSSHSVPAGQI